jgi:GNAT superfamily N-acetyltransferase
MISLEATSRLLREVFPQHAKYRHSGYLEWEYSLSPSGTVIESNEDDDEGRCGHYAVVPQRWRINGGPFTYALSLNTAVSGRSRGKGVFSRLGRTVVERAREQGITALIGVSNAESTHGMVKSLGFQLLGALPVVAVLPTAPRRARIFDLGTVEEMSVWCHEVRRARGVVPGPQREWDAEELLWRTADPAHGYEVLVSDGVLAVIHATSFHGLRVAVIVKVFVRDPTASIGISLVATAACNALRAPMALYAGLNPNLRLGGLQIPTRLRPSPLNLIVKSLVADMKPSELVPDCFEFLDFDAY